MKRIKAKTKIRNELTHPSISEFYLDQSHAYAFWTVVSPYQQEAVCYVAAFYLDHFSIFIADVSKTEQYIKGLKYHAVHSRVWGREMCHGFDW